MIFLRTKPSPASIVSFFVKFLYIFTVNLYHILIFIKIQRNTISSQLRLTSIQFYSPKIHSPPYYISVIHGISLDLGTNYLKNTTIADFSWTEKCGPPPQLPMIIILMKEKYFREKINTYKILDKDMCSSLSRKTKILKMKLLFRCFRRVFHVYTLLYKNATLWLNKTKQNSFYGSFTIMHSKFFLLFPTTQNYSKK